MEDYEEAGKDTVSSCSSAAFVPRVTRGFSQVYVVMECGDYDLAHALHMCDAQPLPQRESVTL
jgi:hypothetical protein